MSTFWRTMTALACVVALAASCGGADDGAVVLDRDGVVDQSSSDQGADDSTDSADLAGNGLPPGFEGLPEGGNYVEGFIGELADLPIGLDAVFSPGRANSAAEDPRETAAQLVYFLAEPAEVTEYYLAELEASGYIVESDSFPKSVAEMQELAEQGVVEAQLVYRDAAGIPLQLTIRDSGFDGITTMNVNRFLSGTR